MRNADACFPVSCCNPTGTGMYKRLASTSSAQRTRKKMGYAPCAHQALCAPCRDAVPSASDGWCSERLLSSRRHGSAHIGSLGSRIDSALSWTHLLRKAASMPSFRAGHRSAAVQARLASRRNTSRRTPRLRAAAAGSNNSNHLQFIWKSLIAAPYVLGGYTSLLMGVDQAATTQSVVRKLHFDGGQNHESI